MKRLVFVTLICILTANAFAIDADGFFGTKPLENFLGNIGTQENNGVLYAIWKMDAGVIKICLEKKATSKDCDTQWLSPAAAVEKINENACYLGFDLTHGDPTIYYRVKRSCD